MKDIDEELSAQISKVFEDLDDGLSEQGWTALRKKYPEQKVRKLPLWWLSTAAAVILCVGGWWWWFNSSQQHHTQHGRSKVGKTKGQIENQTPAQQPVIVKNLPVAPFRQPTTEPHQERNGRSMTSNSQLNSNQPHYTNVQKSPKQPQQSQVLAVREPLPVYLDSNLNPTVSQSLVVAVKRDSTTKTTDIGLQNVEANALATPDKKTTEDFLKGESQRNMAMEKTKKATGKYASVKSSFEVFTGTFLNYAGNTDVKVNAGFGLNANIKVSKSVFLAVGAGISQNKVGYGVQSTVPQTAAANALTVANVAKAAYTSDPFVTDMKLAAQLLAIDLPIVVKFYPTKKQRFYVATGINSNSYLNQQYTYSYNVITPSSLYMGPAAEEKVEKRALSGFDFANSAIFALGIHQRIGASQLIFEPYFKPAIGNMGEKNLKINTVGINLRFNFNDSQKK